MQQALKLRNIQLSAVIEDIMGATAQASIRIISGERDPITLVRLRHPACHSSEETLAKALTGTWQAEQLFVLQQALALFDALRRRRCLATAVPPTFGRRLGRYHQVTHSQTE
jgi:transposase